jgi:hypothetical protein
MGAIGDRGRVPGEAYGRRTREVVAVDVQIRPGNSRTGGERDRYRTRNRSTVSREGDGIGAGCERLRNIGQADEEDSKNC